MPRFVVVFDAEVTYLPDHVKGTRVIAPGTVDGLRVSAPSAHDAMLHAARTTRGLGGPSAVYDDAGRIVWGSGPEAIQIPAPAAPAIESPVGEVAEVFGA